MAADVLPSATWLYCGEPDESQKAVLVQFSNGKLQNPGNMRFTLYQSSDSANPRKRSQRILAAETERLSYVGNNFGTGALKCNTLCRHFVGILNKTSGQMEVYDAELFNMQPLFSDDSVESELAPESQNKTFREKMDSCIEAFGTTKQKRALNSRRMNRVGNESLNHAVAKAAENIIDTKGVNALVSDAAQDDLQDDSLYLPPCHADAATPGDVYRFDDLLSPAEYEALKGPAEAFRSVTSEEILKMAEENSHCSFVIEALKCLPTDEKSRDRQARCLWFLDTLVKFRAQKVIKRKSESVFPVMMPSLRLREGGLCRLKHTCAHTPAHAVLLRCPGTWNSPRHQHQTAEAVHLPDLQQRQFTELDFKFYEGQDHGVCDHTCFAHKRLPG
nr:DNA-directed RNA polymerase I subunit RPA49 isoform X2 [Oryctolagus cuniculus]